MSRWVLLLTLLPLAPLASAGTAEAPELTDAAGDQTVPAPLGTSLDILAAWLEVDERGGVTVTLRVAELNAQSSGTYDVTWGLAGPLDPERAAARGGVRFKIDAAPMAALLEDDGSGGLVERGADFPAVVRDGTPGEMSASFPAEDASNLVGSTLRDFTASARPGLAGVSLVTGGGDADTAAGDGVLALPGLFALGTVAVPPRAADLTGGSTEELPAAADLLGTWFEVQGTDVLLIYELRSLTPESLSDCGSWGLWTYAFGSESEDGLSMYMTATFDDPWLERLYVSASKDEPTVGGSRSTELDAALTLQYGTPGYAQVRLLGADYVGPGLDGSYGSVRASCDKDGNSLEDSLEVNPEFLPAPSLLFAIAAIAGVALLRRRMD
ncbi:MAG: hypothetical protein AABY18_01385 [Candidatus Thermoplasmatota archaeon]|mgnify:CR=1 FL=1